MCKVRVGLIGLGTVGSGVIRLIDEHNNEYIRDLGINIELVLACTRTPTRGAMLGIPQDRFTTDYKDVVSHPDIDVVIELIGGTTTAKDIVLSAIEHKKSVVTANKALMAAHGKEIMDAAQKAGVQVKFEASVGGGIPIIGPLQHSLQANEICTIAGIMNGTTNYILTRMAQDGLPYAEALADAQALGYAEADPTADVDGLDAANKIAILATLGFNSRVTLDDVAVEGIRKISSVDIEYAREMGYAVKLLAIARRTPTGLDVRVHPTMLKTSHPLARVDGVYNAIYVIGDAVSETMFFGPGAGSLPTASAVMGDLLEIGRTIASGGAVVAEQFGTTDIPIRNILDIHTQYYVRLIVNDEPGVLARTAHVFGDNNISILSMVQRQSFEGVAELVYVTHRAAESDMVAALGTIAKVSGVREVATLIRVEDTETWKKGLLS